MRLSERPTVGETPLAQLGAGYAGTLKLEAEAGKRVVMMFGDSGLNYRTVYLENGVFTEAEIRSVMEKKAFNELFDNSYSLAARA